MAFAGTTIGLSPTDEGVSASLTPGGGTFVDLAMNFADLTVGVNVANDASLSKVEDMLADLLEQVRTHRLLTAAVAS